MTPILKMSNAGGMGATLNRYSDMLAGNAAYVGSSYYSIATQTVGSGGASNVTFSSIPSTYTHLQIRAIVRDAGSSQNGFWLRFNGDSTSGNYYWHELYGTGSSALAYAEAPSTVNFGGVMPYSANASQIMGAAIIDILDYSNTNKAKTIRSLAGYDANGSGNIALLSGAWNNSNAAITSILLQDSAGINFSQYSSFALYGVK